VISTVERRWYLSKFCCA